MARIDICWWLKFAGTFGFLPPGPEDLTKRGGLNEAVRRDFLSRRGHQEFHVFGQAQTTRVVVTGQPGARHGNVKCLEAHYELRACIFFLAGSLFLGGS